MCQSCDVNLDIAAQCSNDSGWKLASPHHLYLVPLNSDKPDRLWHQQHILLSPCSLDWLNETLAILISRTKKVDISSVSESRDFQSWSVCTYIQGVELTSSDQSLTWTDPTEQTALQWRRTQPFFKNTENSKTSSRTKATLLLQQKPRENSTRKLQTLLNNSSHIINRRHSDNLISLCDSAVVRCRAPP